MAVRKERGNFRPIYTAIWDDPDFRAFDSDTKVVFFNLRSSRFGNWPCIYVMYPENVAAQTKLSIKTVTKSLMTLSIKSWVAYTPPVVWVIKGLKNDPNWNPANSKQVIGIEEQLRSLPKNPLIAKFCEFYGLKFDWLKPHDPIDESIDNPTDKGIDTPTDGTEAVSRKPEAVSRKPENECAGMNPPAFVLPANISPEIWKAFEEHRKKLRKPMTDRARNLIVGKLNSFGGDANRILEESICNGWQGVFPPKGANGEKNEPKGAAAVRAWATKHGVTA